MIKRKLLFGLALALAAGVAQAQASKESTTTGPMGVPRAESDRTVTQQAEGAYQEGSLRTVTMTVRKVEPAQHKVMLEVQVSPEANITESGRPIKLDQLKEGDEVRASFDPKTGDLVKLQVTQKGTGAKSQSKSK